MNNTKKKNDWKLVTFLAISVILTTIYLVWRIFFTLPLNDGIPQVIFGILLIFAETVTCFTTFELYYQKLKSNKYVLPFPEVEEKDYPHVDVFIATHNEPLDILYKTANACTFMDYPDKEKVHIYFCDDGNRETVAQLAKDLGIGYLGLANNKDAKSGNLNNALAKTNSPLIATFDADMIPQHTFLMKTVPYFMLATHIQDEDTGLWRKRTEEELEDAYKIGLIQTPQSFYNPDLFQFNLYSEELVPNEQDFFSKEVNTMRNSSNAIAYTGSNTVILRQAMVDIGGFPLKTITEDFETSIRIQQEQYITYATDEVQAAGLSTTDFKSMIKQRKRWARGVIQSLQNTRAIFSSKLTTAGRLTYLCSYLYWLSFFNRIIFILAPIMFALFDFRVVDCTFKELLILWLPSYFFYSSSFSLISSSVRTNRWSQTIDTIFAPYMIVCVLLETFGFRETTFKVTSKEKTERSDFIYATPHIILILLSVLAIIRFAYGKFGMELVYSSVIIYWLCFNLVSLIYAVFFMAGRKAYRKSERLKAVEAVEVSYGNTIINTTTVDLADGGIMFTNDTPCYIPENQDIDLTITSERYSSNLTGKVAYVKQRDDKWYYSMTVTPVEENDKRQFSQLIYDRSHSLPSETDLWTTTIDDIIRNIKLRLFIAHKQQRKQARIDINKPIVFKDGSTAFAHDFNFIYITLSNLNLKRSNHNIYILPLSNGIEMKLLNTKRKTPSNSATLFKILNIDELHHQDIDFDDILAELGSK